MPWYKVPMSWDDIAANKHTALQDAFTALFMAAGAPKDAAMFTSADIRKNVDYFSPRAVEIAKTLIVRSGGVECPAPTRSAVDLLVGSRSGVEAIQFSPEPKPEAEDNG